MKIYDKEGNSIGLNFGLEKIREIFEKESFKNRDKKGKVINSEDLKELHKEFLLKYLTKSKIEFAVDFSNGVGSIVLIDILKDNYNFVPLNQNIDGNFPSHPPEPTEENLTHLKDIVKTKKLDFGACFDGDADRIVFIDDYGNVIRGDQMLYIFSSRLNAKKIVCDISFPPKFTKVLNSLNKKVYESKVGRAFVINKMREINADIGGEISCHFYFKETNFMEDAYYSLLLLISILEKEKKKLSQILEEYKIGKFLTYKVKVDDNIKYATVEKIKENFEKEYEVNTTDGIKVIISEEDWFLIRASNTEPVIRIHIEAQNTEKIEKYKELINNAIKRYISNLYQQQ